MTHTNENQAKQGSTGIGKLVGTESKIEESARSLLDKIGDKTLGQTAESQYNESQPVQADGSEVRVPTTEGRRSVGPDGKDTYHGNADKDPSPEA
ncbi:hypothetical protein BC834DRAFT_1040987 [Gloeopeniophorella convolvens]|nr:hypothetical protein BC834DRAFT_1040987 [Gloeopeniophorella convolvens]